MRWNTLKGSISVILFVAVAVLAEVLIVLYAMDLGVKDVGELKTSWPFAITISPLFQLVPIAVILTLSFTWIYLTKKLSARPVQPIGRPDMRQLTSRKSQPPKSSLEKTKQASPSAKGASSAWQKRMYSSKATVKSALTIFLAFAILVLIVSQLAYPGAIYQAITNSYKSHSALYNFVVSIADSLRGFAQAVSPIGAIATTINNGFVAIAPGVRAFCMAFGGLVAPLANLDPAGKYLAFQNLAAWISVILVFLYGQYSRRSYRYRKK
jgi:hypothetical protein